MILLFAASNILVISLHVPLKYISYNNIRPLYFDLYQLEENFGSKKIFDEKYSSYSFTI